MASTLPPAQAPLRSNYALLVKHRSPPAPFLLLFFFLLLSLLLLLALALLHINDFLIHSFSNPSLFHFLSPRLSHNLQAFLSSLSNPSLFLSPSPLLFDKLQSFLSSLLYIQQHNIGFLLSPCPVFILANFIIFTIIVKSFFLPSSSSSSPLSDFSDSASEKSEYDGARLPEHVLQNHEDVFLSSPSYQHCAFSHDAPEEHHVLSFSSAEESYTYVTNVQRYNKLNNKWEKVRGVSMAPYISSNITNGAVAQKEAMRLDKVMTAEKALSTLAASAAPPYNILSVEQGKVMEKAGALQEARLDRKTSRSVKATTACDASPGSQAVVINMEPVPARRTHISTNPPPPAPFAPSQQPVRASAPPLNTSTTMAQRPPSSPKVKKITQSTEGFLITANDGRHEASKPLLDGEKQEKEHNKPQEKLNDKSTMVRSYPNQQSAQQTLSPEVTTALITSPSSSSTNRLHMQRSHSLRSSSTPNATGSFSSINRPHIQRARSLRSSGSPDTIALSSKATRSPSSSESLDGLSDAEANKCFSDYIAHRFALMKKELDVHST